jgi:polyisoprenoid-binding protein YceI
MRFESTRIEHIEGGTYRIAGDLTIKDQTREVEMDATVEGTGEDPWGNERVGEEVKILIDVSAVRV